MITRRFARASAGWLFGLATTILLIAVWGRAVVIDVDALEEAAAPFADSAAVADMLTDWLDTELADAGVDSTTSELAIEEVLQQSSVVRALGQFASEIVLAAASPGPGAGMVEVSRLVQPAVPEIGAALTSAGIPVSESRVAELVAGLDPLVVRGAGTQPYIGSASPTAARLGTAAMLSMVVMALSGWVAVAAADDRVGEARGLLSRVAVGALSFAIILRAGSWVLDPGGGRAPLAESASIVAGSKSLVVLVIAGVAGAAAGLTWAVRRVVRRGAGFPSPIDQPTPQPERQRIRSGRG